MDLPRPTKEESCISRFWHLQKGGAASGGKKNLLAKKKGTPCTWRREGAKGGESGPYIPAGMQRKGYCRERGARKQKKYPRDRSREKKGWSSALFGTREGIPLLAAEGKKEE